MALQMDLLGVLALSVGVSCFIEFMQWVLIYRRPHFRQVKQWLAVQNKKLADLSKDSGPGTGALKGKAKKQERIENSMKMETGRLFATMKMQQVGLNLVATLGAYRLLGYFYGGVVVAKLPFEPWPFFQKITHRGLAGSVATDAALSLIYALVQAGVRPNLAAWLDVGPSRAMQGLMAKNSELVQKKVATATGL